MVYGAVAPEGSAVPFWLLEAWRMGMAAKVSGEGDKRIKGVFA